jgi:hypothetical protein
MQEEGAQPAGVTVQLPPSRSSSIQEEGAQPAAVTIQLRHPVELASLKITELKFPARLKGRHVRRYSTNERGVVDADVCLRVAADATGQPDRVFDELDGEDVARVVEVMTGLFFLQGFLRITPAS